jgi:5-oxoprolinase (ATP-hydrolysing) subunit A
MMDHHPGWIDLNADLGEGYPNDARLFRIVTSASVSCGAHAGDRATIMATLREAQARGVAVGSHPGYPDRAHFGRRERAVNAGEVLTLILDQHRDLARLADECGVVLRFVKPHGALYNQAQKEPAVAREVLQAARELGLPVLGQPGSLLAIGALQERIRFVAEGFADRRYEPDGRLVPRSRPDAVVHDPAEVEAQVVRLAAQGVETLCIHGDHPDAARNAEQVRVILERHDIAPRFWA